MTGRPLIGFWLTVLIWTSVVGGLWAREEYLVTHGREIILPTLPVDPRDLFRGDYVVLRYDISRYAEPFHKKRNFDNGQTVYVVLKPEGPLWRIEDVVPDQPDRGFFLSGRVSKATKEKYRASYEIEYGIESYFVTEGEGKKLEALREKKKLNAVINVAPGGQAKIKKLIAN